MSERDQSLGLVATLRSMPRGLYVIGLATLISRSGGFLAIFGSIYLTSISITYDQAVAVLSAAGICGMAGSLLSGRLADRFTPKSVLIVASLINSMALGVLASRPGTGVSAAIVVVASTMTQAFVPPAAASVEAFAPDAASRTPFFAFFRLFLNLGSALSPMLAAVLGETRFDRLFVYSAGANLAASALLATMFRTTGARGQKNASETTAPVDRANPTGVWPGVAVLAALAVVASVYAQYQSTLPLEIRATHGQLRLYSVLLVVNSGLVILGELPLSLVTRRFPIRTSLTAGVTIMTIGLTVSGAFAGSVVALVLGAVLFTAGEMVFAPVANTAAASLAPAGRAATYQGYLSSGQALGFALGPAAGVALYFRTDSAAWVVFGLTGLACALVLAGVVRTGPPLPEAANATPKPEAELDRPSDSEGLQCD
ncbi:MAG: MFS transporter [Bifidobacteriaceae bacterium]|nr:MFS transporter [Bifidobacteriaceae bacterium]